MPDIRSEIIDALPQTATIAPQFGALLSVISRNPAPQAEVDAWEWQNSMVPKLRASGFDLRYMVPNIEFHPEQRRVFEFTDSKCQNTGAIVALVGIRGVGKTALVSQLAIERLREWSDWYGKSPEDRAGKSPRGMALYRKMSAVVMGMKSLYSDFGSIDTKNELRERDKVTERALLIIDELHDCDDQKMKNRILTDIVDIRYANKRDTILISNQTPEEFQQSTSDSILSRLSEHGAIIPCVWESFR